MKKLMVALLLLLPVAGAADFQTGAEAQQRGDYATALREWRPLAEAGDAASQYNIANIYATGNHGVAKNETEAFKWFRKAAGQGNTSAQYNLASMYRMGKGVPRNNTEAAKWYRLAAEQGDAPAQYNLGVLYLQGRGMPMDKAQGYSWMTLAANQGDKMALKSINRTRNTLTRAQIGEAQKLSRERCTAIPGCAL